MLTLKINIQTMKCDYSDREAIMARLKRSFSMGVGSIMSLQGGNARISLGSAKTDAEQLREDWEAVGRELWSAYDEESDNYTHSLNDDKTSKSNK